MKISALSPGVLFNILIQYCVQMIVIHVQYIINMLTNKYIYIDEMIFSI